MHCVAFLVPEVSGHLTFTHIKQSTLNIDQHQSWRFQQLSVILKDLCLFEVRQSLGHCNVESIDHPEHTSVRNCKPRKTEITKKCALKVVLICVLGPAGSNKYICANFVLNIFWSPFSWVKILPEVFSGGFSRHAVLHLGRIYRDKKNYTEKQYSCQ